MKAVHNSVTPRLLEILQSTPPEGISLPDLAVMCGSTARSVVTMLWRYRQSGRTTAGTRFVDGVERVFSADVIPPPADRLKVSSEMRKKLHAAGAAGVRRSVLMGNTALGTFSGHVTRLGKAGELFICHPGASRDEVMYFSTEQAAKAFLAERRKAKEQATKKPRKPRTVPSKKLVSAVLSAVAKAAPAKKAAHGKPSETAAIKSAPVVNPNGIKPVVLPTPLPRFHVDTVGRHVSSNECRPWAMYA